MNAAEKALVASISKLRRAGYMKAAHELEDELRRLQAAPAPRPVAAKAKPPALAKAAPPPAPEPDDDTLDPDGDEDDDEPEAPAKFAPHTRGGSSMTLEDHGGPGQGVVTIEALVAAARRLLK